MYEVIAGILNLLNSVGAGVIANYIFKILCKWLDSSSAGNNQKH